MRFFKLSVRGSETGFDRLVVPLTATSNPRNSTSYSYYRLLSGMVFALKGLQRCLARAQLRHASIGQPIRLKSTPQKLFNPVRVARSLHSSTGIPFGRHTFCESRYH